MTDGLLAAVALLSVLVSNGVLTAAYLLALRRAGGGRGSPGRTASAATGRTKTVALVRPLKGLEPEAARANHSLLEQSYRGLETVLFVATSPGDPGLAFARATLGDDPRVGLRVADLALSGGSDKGSNMIAGWHATTAPFVAFCDADITLEGDALERCMARFDDPAVGAVFAPAFHVGRDAVGKLVMLVASGDKLAIAHAHDRLGLLDFMEGGLMILRRSAVEQAGGIEMVSRALADDLRLAVRLRQHGYRLRAGPPVLHPIAARTLSAWARQYHRWTICQRSEKPALLWPQIVFHPVAVPLVLALTHGAAWRWWALVWISVLWRTALTAAIDRSLVRPLGERFGWWAVLRPVADLLHWAMCLTAYLLPSVTWRGKRYRLGRHGRAAPWPAGTSASTLPFARPSASTAVKD